MFVLLSLLVFVATRERSRPAMLRAASPVGVFSPLSLSPSLFLFLPPPLLFQAYAPKRAKVS